MNMHREDFREIVEAEMETALLNGEFHVYLQPKINMITSRVYGAEALSRWVHPTYGILSPDKYIPIFEENGFIFKLDMYMFEEICKMKARWREQDVGFENIPISINMSRPHLLRQAVVDELLDITKKYDVDPSEIDIEITENMYLKDHTALTEVVCKLQSFGFHVSIDDFGSGFSALNMLKDIPVDTIKIDKEFLQISTNNERGKKVIKHIILLCKDLKFNIMVEGVETAEQVKFLVGYGCEIVQGFYYSRPITVEEFEAYTKAHYTVSMDVIKFSFNNNLVSDDGRYVGKSIGNNWSYDRGIAKSINGIHFYGGPHYENGIELPKGIIHSDSYSVSMWIKVDRLITWSAVLFCEYENGFFQFCPLAKDGEACYRIRDRQFVEGWFDSVTDPLRPDVWYHIVIMYDRMRGRSCMYINGKEVGHCDDVEALYFVKRISVGTDIYKPCFEGTICELIFYDRALRWDDVENLYKSYIMREDFDAV